MKAVRADCAGTAAVENSPSTKNRRSRTPLLSRRIHKWLALLVGLQAVLWTLGGVYMTIIHIDIIHGDHFIRSAPRQPLDIASLASPVEAMAQSGAKGARLAWLGDRPVYLLTGEDGERMVDARTNVALDPPDRATVAALARASFAGSEPLVKLDLVADLPLEVRGRTAPLWRAEFGGWNRPTLYFSPATGQLVTRRHQLWRAFDVFWMLHIMDYDDREDVNNMLLKTFSWLTVLSALSGVWMLWFAVFGRGRRRR